MLLECGPPSTGTRVAGGGILTLSHCRHLCERERPAVVVKAVVTLSVLHFFFYNGKCLLGHFFRCSSRGEIEGSL